MDDDVKPFHYIQNVFCLQSSDKINLKLPNYQQKLVNKYHRLLLNRKETIRKL